MFAAIGKAVCLRIVFSEPTGNYQKCQATLLVFHFPIETEESTGPMEPGSQVPGMSATVAHMGIFAANGCNANQHVSFQALVKLHQASPSAAGIGEFVFLTTGAPRKAG